MTLDERRLDQFADHSMPFAHMGSLVGRMSFGVHSVGCRLVTSPCVGTVSVRFRYGGQYGDGRVSVWCLYQFVLWGNLQMFTRNENHYAHDAKTRYAAVGIDNYG